MTPSLRWLALALGVVAGACHSQASADDASTAIIHQGARLVLPPRSPLRASITVDSAISARIQESFTATAVVEADPAHVARIFPPMAGRVVKLLVHFGDSVHAGQPLVTLEASDFAQALADYRRAQSSLIQTQRTHDRVLDLHTNGVASQREVEQAETDLSQAKAEADRTAARLKSLGVNPANATASPTLEIRAPLTGVVVDLSTAEGEFRNDASAPLMTLSDLSTVWLTANVQEKDIHAVVPGQIVAAAFAAYPGETVRGAVRFVGDVLDPDTRTVKVRIGLPNANRRFRPGMFATVTFLGQAGEAVLAPTTAIVQLRDTTYVYAEVAPWTFEPRPVAIAQQQGDRTVIRSGLAHGDRIITRGALLLQ